MKGPGAVFSGLLFVATFVLFPYVGMLLRITCSHNPTTDSQFQGRKTLLSAHPDYLHTGEIVGGKTLSALFNTACECIVMSLGLDQQFLMLVSLSDFGIVNIWGAFH